MVCTYVNWLVTDTEVPYAWYTWDKNQSVLWIRDVYPVSRSGFFSIGSRNQHPQKRGGGKFVALLFCCSHKFHKIENYLIFLTDTKNLSQLTKNLSIFTPTIVTKLSEIWVEPIRYPGSGKKYPGSGSKGQKSTRSRSPISNSRTNVCIVCYCGRYPFAPSAVDPKWIRH
jgi:hypothetical protein